MSARVVVIGVGNRYRRDDGFGPTVIDAIAAELPPDVVVHESDGEPTRLLDMWDGADLAVVVETVRQGAEPGTIADIDATTGLDAAADGGAGGTHSLGIADAIALARALERTPRRLRVIGVEPADLGQGAGLSDAVTRSLATVSRLVLDVVRAHGFG